MSYLEACFFTPLAVPTVRRNSWARDKTHATAVTQATTVLQLQHQIPNPLREARDRIPILMDCSWIRFCCATTGTPEKYDYIAWYTVNMQKC